VTTRFAPRNDALHHEPVKLNPVMVQLFHWRMIFSESRFSLSGIVL
jgi:hypothetical protein